jgi:uncharacterized OB-fold protein
MNTLFDGVEPMVYESGISVPYNWWAGDTASRFFVGLRDEQKIWGTRCASCGVVRVPPRKACPVCFHSQSDWIEVSAEGMVKTFTIARRQLAALKQSVPVIFGLIRLDGADTSLLHCIGDVSPEAVQIGMRVKAKYSEIRRGEIRDIACFVPCEF